MELPLRSALQPAARQRGVRRGPLSPAALVGLAVCAIGLIAALLALGTWQVERRQWKLDLIERVEQRVHASAVAAPGPTQWPLVTPATHEYRRVQVTGTYLHDLAVWVQATTRLGSGYWLLTPLRTADGSTVLVNRGFVPPEARDRPASSGCTSTGESIVTGLLRFSEPGGAFLRHNDPGANRWYSRDVLAIAASLRMTRVAPYFVDADAAGPSLGEAPDAALDTAPDSAPVSAAHRCPVGGLTVIAFPNNHLVYAITWYALALMTAGATGYVGREEWRLRQLGQQRREGDTSRPSSEPDET